MNRFTIFSFKKHVLNHHPRDILSLDEFFQMRTEVVREQDGPLIPEGDDAPPPGDEPPPGMEPNTDKVGKIKLYLINVSGIYIFA